MRIKTIFILIIVLLLTACAQGESTKNMMKPPELSEEKQEILKILQDNLPKGASLIIPLNGQYNQPIHFIDLDQNGEDEVIVFYKLDKDQSPLQALILARQGEQWRKKATIEGVGNQFDQVIFKDITGDHNLEIVIGWNIGKHMMKGVSIYQYNNGDVKEIFTESYEELVVDDLNNDGRSEVVIVKLDRDSMVSKASLYQYNGEDMSMAGLTRLDGSVNGYYSVKTGWVDDGIKGIFLDAGVGAHSAITELLVFENNQLKNVFLNEDTETVEKTLKVHAAISQDMNDDGIIEIPLFREPIGYDQAAIVDVPWITSWYRWRGDEKLELVGESYDQYFSPGQGLRFSFPENWNENVTVKRHQGIEIDEGEISFIYYDQNKNKEYDLGTIAVLKDHKWNEMIKKWDAKGLEYLKLDVIDGNAIALIAGRSQNLPKKIKDMKLNVEEMKNLVKIIDEKI